MEEKFTIQLNDINRFQTSTRKITDEGFLQADAAITRPGIATYHESELAGFNVKGDSNGIVKVFRPPSTVFSDKAMQSFASKVVTDDHPRSKEVTSKNARREQVGHIGDTLKRQENEVVARVTITDEASIKKIQDGKLFLSAGYSGSISSKKGITDSGEQYDAILTNMIGNHVALTDSPRAGSKCRLLDSNNNKEEKTMGKITVQGIDIEVGDQASQAFKALNDSMKKSQNELASLTKLNDSLKVENETLKGKSDELQKKINDSGSFDSAVAKRVDLIDSAKRFIPKFEFTGKSKREINVAIMNKFNDSFKDTDMSDEYLQGRVDGVIAVADSQKKADPHGIKAISDSAAVQLEAAGSYLQKKQEQSINKKTGAK